MIVWFDHCLAISTFFECTCVYIITSYRVVIVIRIHTIVVAAFLNNEVRPIAVVWRLKVVFFVGWAAPKDSFRSVSCDEYRVAGRECPPQNETKLFSFYLRTHFLASAQWVQKVHPRIDATPCMLQLLEEIQIWNNVLDLMNIRIPFVLPAVCSLCSNIKFFGGDGFEGSWIVCRRRHKVLAAGGSRLMINLPDTFLCRDKAILF